MSKTFVIVKVIILNDHDEVLILKRGLTAPRRPGAWDLPGGFVAHGEDISQGAIREVAEETGITLQNVSLLYSLSEFEPKIEAGGNWLVFVGKTRGHDYTISWEHDAAKWVPAGKLNEYVTEGKQGPALQYVVKHDLVHAQHDTHPSA